VKDLVLIAGAIDVGVVTTETLEGGPHGSSGGGKLEGTGGAFWQKSLTK